MLNLHTILPAVKTHFKTIYLGLEWIYFIQIMNATLIK